MSKGNKKRHGGQAGQPSASTGGSQLPTPKPESTPLAGDPISSSSQNIEPSGSSEPSDSKAKVVPKVVTVQPTPEMAQAAEAMEALSANFGNIARALDTLQSQAVWLSSHHESVKIQEELNKVRRDLEKQLHSEEEDIKVKKHDLEERIKEPAGDDMREEWNNSIRAIIQSRVSAQVEQELCRQIPEEVMTRARNHQDRMQQIDDAMYNDEIKRRNALVRREHEPLNRLRIPKAVAMSRSSSGSQGSGSVITPSTAGYPQTPANSLLLVGTSMPPSNDDMLVSPVFPSNIGQLYEYCKTDRAKLRQFLNDYGEDVPDAGANDQQAIDQLNKALNIVGVRNIHVSPVPQAPPSARASRRPRHDTSNTLLSPLMIHRS